MFNLEKEIEGALFDWNVPGGAVTIFHEGEVVSCKGYGVLQAGKAETVNPETIFAIGSATKSFTAAAVGILVDDKKLTWDTPVKEIIPEFDLSDPWVTSQMTVRDLVAQRTGFGRLNRMLFGPDYTVSTMVHRLRYWPSATNFRQDFVYSNENFITAGFVIERLTGFSWDRMIQERILDPLEMSHSTTCVEGLRGTANLASPHAILTDRFLPSNLRIWGQPAAQEIVNLGSQPAGGIFSTAADLAHWLEMLAGGGFFRGKQILSPATFDDMCRSQTPILHPKQSDLEILVILKTGTQFYSYGLGWFVIDYRGRKVVFHPGQVPGGSTSLIGFVPEENLAFSILLNTYQGMAHVGMMFTIIDAFTGGLNRNWNRELLSGFKSLKFQAEARLAEKMASNQDHTSATLPIEAYAGTYANEVFGEMKVTYEKGQLVLRYGSFYDGILEHQAGDVFMAIWKREYLDADRVSFSLTESGQVNTLKINNEPALKRI